MVGGDEADAGHARDVVSEPGEGADEEAEQGDRGNRLDQVEDRERDLAPAGASLSGDAEGDADEEGGDESGNDEQEVAGKGGLEDLVLGGVFAEEGEGGEGA